MDRYAVIGNPVAHSLSPQIHEMFAQATGQVLSYERLLAPLDGFTATANNFFAAGGCGANVTVPFKMEAARLAEELDEPAEFAKAVNTLVPVTGADRGLKGYNTDGGGLLRDLQRHLGANARGFSVLLIGAGGAARGVAAPLMGGFAERLVIANRTIEKAQAITRALTRKTRHSVRACGLAEIEGSFDVVINASSAGLSGAPPAISPARVRGAFCYDMVYGQNTPFCRWARASGASGTVDGLGMLVEQAGLAFELWRGIAPDTQAVLDSLRDGRKNDERP